MAKIRIYGFYLLKIKYRKLGVIGLLVFASWSTGEVVKQAYKLSGKHEIKINN